MVTLEQVKLLEAKVSRTIDYVKNLTEENSTLRNKLDSYQKRIDDLEVLIQRFKEDQGKIEEGILSALDRLNQFEDALETTLSARSSKKGSEGEKQAAGLKKEPEPPAGRVQTSAVLERSYSPPEPPAEPQTDAAQMGSAQMGAALEEDGSPPAEKNPESRELDIF